MIDPASTAICVIELQNDLCYPSLCDQRGLRGALARAVRDAGILTTLPPLLDACRSAGIRVVYCTKEREPGAPQPEHPPIARSAGNEPILVHGTPGADVVEQVAPKPGDVLLPRMTGIDPSADHRLWHLGFETMIFTGISTTFAVEGAVRAAANRSLRAIVVEDCCAGVPEAWHRFSMDNVMPLLASVTNAAALEAKIRP